jgi:hypothetical protein
MEQGTTPAKPAPMKEINLPEGTRCYHRQRGTEYTILGMATLKKDASTILRDDAQMVLYVNRDDDKLWVREITEFLDGRFVIEDPEEPKRPT